MECSFLNKILIKPFLNAFQITNLPPAKSFAIVKNSEIFVVEYVLIRYDEPDFRVYFASIRLRINRIVVFVFAVLKTPQVLSATPVPLFCIVSKRGFNESRRGVGTMTGLC